MRSTVFIFAIVAAALAITAALLPTQKDGGSIQSFKITYEKPSAPVADENLERPESPPPATQSWTQLLDTPKIEIVEEDTTIQKIKRQPTKTLADLKKETFSSQLGREGFSPVSEPQVLPNGLVLTIYDDTEKVLADANAVFAEVGIKMDMVTAHSLQGSSLEERTVILQDWMTPQSPTTFLPYDLIVNFDNADHTEKIAILTEFFHGELSQDKITVLVDGYESLD